MYTKIYSKEKSTLFISDPKEGVRDSLFTPHPENLRLTFMIFLTCSPVKLDHPSESLRLELKFTHHIFGSTATTFFSSCLVVAAEKKGGEGGFTFIHRHKPAKHDLYLKEK